MTLSPRWRRALALLPVAALGGVMYIILPAPTLTIAVHQGVEGVPLKKVAERFCREHYNGKVKIVELDYDGLYAAEWSAVTGEDAPYPFTAPPRFDVIMLDDPWLPAFAGDVEPLDARQLTGATGGDGMGDFPQPCRDVCRRNGAYYAMPFSGNSQLLCRTADVPQPVGWNDLTSLPNTSDRLGYAMRLGPGNSVVTDFLPILWSVAPESFRGDYSVHDPQKLAQAFRLFHKLAEKQHWASAVTQDVDVAVSIALQSASTGIVWNAWAMALQQFEQTKDKLVFEWFRDPQQHPVLGAWLLAVPRKARHKKEAKAFIQYAIGKRQLELAADFGNPPPRISVLTEPANAKRYQPMYNSLANARPRPRTPCWRQVEAAVSQALSTWREETSKEVIDALLKDLKDIQARETGNACAVP